MGKRRLETPTPAPFRAARGGFHGRHTRASWSLPFFAFFACITLILSPAIDSSAAVAMSDDGLTTYSPGPTQTFTATSEGDVETNRGNYGVSKIQQKAAASSGSAAPAAGTPDPGSAKAIAKSMVEQRGWGASEYDCLVALWGKESGWNVYAFNAGSGAYGIPQAVPGNKMATVGSDWKTSAKTQITWGLGYIQGRYQTPCGAWGHSQSSGWY